MPNIGHFMIPANDVGRARHFYHSLLGWKIEPPGMPMGPGMDQLQYHEIVTGKAETGMLSGGGLYKRHMNEPILNFVFVEDIDKVLVKVEKLGGKITLKKTEIPGVGLNAMIQDPEGNIIGLLQPVKK
jgi:predicted enzyme related to lactoylglutathione lyase